MSIISSMGLKAIMYPYAGNVAGQCFDSSPFFAERPNLIAGAGLALEFNHFAVDIDMDSLAYEWAQPISQPPSIPIPYNIGFSVNSPLPGVSHNSNNVPAVLNPVTGAITFTSYNTGLFVTVVKVSSYRCGQLIAEIFREIAMVIGNNGVIPVAGNPPNQLPVIPPPFQDALGNWVYNLSVTAGDTIEFAIAAIDNDPHPIAISQLVELDANGPQFGAGFSDPAIGCLIPPCAFLDPVLPFSGMGITGTDFYWRTGAQHLGFSFNCVQFNNVYNFLFKAKDNFCPYNGVVYKTITITVLPIIPKPQITLNAGIMQCTLAGPYRFQWFLDRWAISGADSTSHTPIQSGYYQVLTVDTLTGHGNYSERFAFFPLNTPIRDNSMVITLQPNPAINGAFNILIDGMYLEDAVLSITDMTGRQVLEQTVSCMEPPCTVPLRLVQQQGVYLVNITTKQGKTVKKIVLTKE